jgi:soluble lytic murein transglycosylase-like protein
MSRDDLIALAKQTATAHNLFPQLICGIVEQESAWDVLAIRLEEDFYRHYIRPMVESGQITPSEGALRATSIGLMQVMLESVREIGYTGTFDDLAIPGTNLEWGCRLFAAKLAHAEGNVNRALLLYNGGTSPNYPSEVLARAQHYQ